MINPIAINLKRMRPTSGGNKNRTRDYTQACDRMHHSLPNTSITWPILHCIETNDELDISILQKVVLQYNFDGSTDCWRIPLGKDKTKDD